jgi:hypothetical protein
MDISRTRVRINHSNFLLHVLQFGVEKCALQFFWSGKLSTPIYLEWTTFHSKIFHYLGVNNHALKGPSKNLECTWSPLQKFWSAPQVYSKIFGVHFKSTPKSLECTQSALQKNWSAQNSTPKMSNFWSEQPPTPIFLEWTAVHSIFFGLDTFPTPKCWSACSKSLECI